MPSRRRSADRTALAGFAISLALALVVVPAAFAGAGPAPRLAGAHDVAGRSPFAGRDCNVATPYYTSPGGKEGEPTIAVNPPRPANRIAAYMDATRATLDVAYTRNGGRSWKRSVPGGVDGCTGNNTNMWEASGDPWVSIGPDGRAYLSGLSWAHFVTPPTSDYVSVVHVQTSSNGGRSWSRPVDLDGQRSVSDKPMVLANPYRAGAAYVIWRNQGFGLATGPRATTQLLFASTHDGGRHWSRPTLIQGGTSSDFFGSPQVSLLRNGTLVATSSLANPTGGTNLLSWRSTDGGRHWGAARTIQRIASGENPTFCGQAAAGGDAGSSSGQQTVVRGRSVLFVYLDGAAASAGHGRLVMARSDDGGRSWRTSTVVRSRDPILLASVAADRHGRLGMVWDQVNVSGVDCSKQTIPTQTRFATSANGGSRWSQFVPVGPRWWNLATSARGSGGFSGYFIGDYQSVAPTARGFTTATVQGPALTRRHRVHLSGATGVVVADLNVGRTR